MNKIKKLPRAAVWVLAVELLVLLWLAAQLARPTADIQLAAADLQPMAELQLSETDGAVTFADGQQEAFAAQAAGDPAAVYWLYGALPRLSAGRYAVTVEYTAPDTPESETALRLVMDTGESVDVGGTCLLPGQKTRFEGHFWLENAAAAPGIELYACAPSVSLVSVAVREVWSWRLVRLLAAAALFAALDGFLWLLRPTGGDANRRTMLLALAGLVFLVSLPCLGGFAVYGTDLHYHMDRVANIAAGLRGGQFPVFIYPDFMNGYGYASPVFYGEALLYLPARHIHIHDHRVLRHHQGGPCPDNNGKARCRKHGLLRPAEPVRVEIVRQPQSCNIAEKHITGHEALRHGDDFRLRLHQVPGVHHLCREPVRERLYHLILIDPGIQLHSQTFRVPESSLNPGNDIIPSLAYVTADAGSRVFVIIRFSHGMFYLFIHLNFVQIYTLIRLLFHFVVIFINFALNKH